MTLPQDPATGRRPGVARHNTRCPASWPILGCSAALLAGAVALVLAGKASVTFLVTFVSSTAILLLLIAESGHGLLAAVCRLRELPPKPRARATILPHDRSLTGEQPPPTHRGSC